MVSSRIRFREQYGVVENGNGSCGGVIDKAQLGRLHMASQTDNL